MIKFDFYFHYLNVGRFIMLNKFSLNNRFNSYIMLQLDKAITCFSIKNLEDLEDLCISNYFFFLFFFFGGQSFFFNFSNIFRLGITYYSFFVQCMFTHRCIFFVLNFLFNEMLYAKVESIILNNIICKNFSVSDVSIFTEKRTTILGLFYLKHAFNIRFFFSTSWLNEDVLFNLFKLKIRK